jgi:hypothetical protein
VAINADESAVLNEHLQTSDPVPLDADDHTRCDGGDGSADGRRDVDAVVKDSGERLFRKDTGSVGGRYASRVYRGQ